MDSRDAAIYLFLFFFGRNVSYLTCYQIEHQNKNFTCHLFFVFFNQKSNLGASKCPSAHASNTNKGRMQKKGENNHNRP